MNYASFFRKSFRYTEVLSLAFLRLISKFIILKHLRYLYFRFAHRTKHPFCVLYAESECLFKAKWRIIKGKHRKSAFLPKNIFLHNYCLYLLSSPCHFAVWGIFIERNRKNFSDWTNWTEGVCDTPRVYVCSKQNGA